MDLSFALRQKAKKTADSPDLAVLLSEISARQSLSRTAQIHHRTDIGNSTCGTDPLVAIFALAGQAAARTHRFSDQILNPVNARQLT